MKLATDKLESRSELDIATFWETVMQEASCGTVAPLEDLATIIVVL